MKALFAEIGFIVLCISLSTLQVCVKYTQNYVILQFAFIRTLLREKSFFLEYPGGQVFHSKPHNSICWLYIRAIVAFISRMLVGATNNRS